MKQKNYYKLFADFCIKNELWFAVCANGGVDELTDTSGRWVSDYNDIDLDKSYIFGTKAAYEALVKTYALYVEGNHD